MNSFSDRLTCNLLQSTQQQYKKIMLWHTHHANACPNHNESSETETWFYQKKRKKKWFRTTYKPLKGKNLHESLLWKLSLPFTSLNIHHNNNNHKHNHQKHHHCHHCRFIFQYGLCLHFLRLCHKKSHTRKILVENIHLCVAFAWFNSHFIVFVCLERALLLPKKSLDEKYSEK